MAVLHFEPPFGLIGKHIVDFLLMLIELFLLCVTVEALRATISSKSAISLQHGRFDPKFQVEGVAPINHFCTDRPVISYKVVADSFHIKKLSSRLL